MHSKTPCGVSEHAQKLFSLFPYKGETTRHGILHGKHRLKVEGVNLKREGYIGMDPKQLRCQMALAKPLWSVFNVVFLGKPLTVRCWTKLYCVITHDLGVRRGTPNSMSPISCGKVLLNKCFIHNSGDSWAGGSEKKWLTVCPKPVATIVRWGFQTNKFPSSACPPSQLIWVRS